MPARDCAPLQTPLSYGTWPSTISASAVAERGVGSSATLKELHLDEDCVYWLEPRPQEGGRSVIMRRSASGSICTLTPDGYDVRSRVHDYGGGAYAVRQGTVIFSNNDDQRVYRHEEGRTPTPLTPTVSERDVRFGDLCLTPDAAYALAVRERLQPEAIMHDLVAIPVGHDQQALCVLHEGADFYSSPRISPDGKQLAWITWSHPHLPWDESTLMLATFEGGRLQDPQVITGEPGVSILQPAWSPTGNLYYLSDESGWWNLYQWKDGKGIPVYPKAREIGSVPWVFGLQDYAFLSGDEIVWVVHKDGCERLEHYRLGQESPRTLTPDLTSCFPSSLDVHAGEKLWFIGASFLQPQAITVCNVREASCQRVYTPRHNLDSDTISTPESVVLCEEEELPLHAFVYPPQNPLHCGLPGERPPLLVYAHSGPTSAARPFLRLEIQFWTSRGFVVADVNYRGSTGFGRAFRHALNGAWGFFDVEDCGRMASHMASIGKVDPNRMFIRGRSAGGFTVLRALMTSDIFAGGTSYYGITDLERLQQFSNNLEAHYLEQLVGAYPAERAEYRNRSPLHYPEALQKPVLILQGLKDPLVPPEQAERFVDTLEQHRLPYRFLTLPDEGHGFKRFESVREALDTELAFYRELLALP